MHLALAGVAALVLLVIPGAALSAALLPKASRLWHLAVAPAVSLGLLYGVALYVDLLGGRVQATTVALPVLLAAAGLLLARRGRGLWGRVVLRPEHAALALAVVLGALVLALSIGAPDTVPAYDDGAQHGIFARRIELLGTVDPGRVVATDLASGSSGVAYYPLGMHMLASFLVELTGVPTATALHLVLLVCTAGAFPTGAFVLARQISPTGHPRQQAGLAAASAALLAVLIPATPWAELPWGGLPLAAAISVMPGVLLLGINVFSAVSRSGWLLGAAAAGLFHLHNSELISVALMLLPVALLLARRDTRSWRRILGGLLAAATVFVVLTGPVLHLLAGAVSERSGGDPTVPTGVGDAIRAQVMMLFAAGQAGGWPGLLQSAVTVCGICLVLAGIWRLRRSPTALGLMVGATAILGLAVAALAGASWAYVAAIPWYANGLRVGAPTAVVLLVVAGHGVAMVRWSAARLALIPLVAVLAVGGLVVGLDVGTTSYAGKSVVTDADRAAFVWLGSHVTAGTRVLNDPHDGSMWMYDLAGVAPVFGPKSDLWMSRTFESRRYLLAHAQDMPDDRRAGRIVAEWAVDYVFVGERTVTGEPRQLDLAGLLESSSWRVAFQQGGAYVFEHLGGASANHHPVASAGTSSTKPSS